MPADCIIVDMSNDLYVRQPRRKERRSEVKDDSDDEDEEIKTDDLRKEMNNDPFLWADTFVMEGQAKAVVVCVGEYCSRDPVEKPLNTRKTNLENTMTNIFNSILFMSAIAILVIVGTGIVMQCIYYIPDEASTGATLTAKIMETLTLGLILVIVSIPEGLPMVITISLAFSVERMLDNDKLLIKDIEAPEVLGTVTEIICGKTGTLTTEDMEVKHFYS